MKEMGLKAVGLSRRSKLIGNRNGGEDSRRRHRENSLKRWKLVRAAPGSFDFMLSSQAKKAFRSG
jgi:phage terminase small subunit